MPAAGEGAGGVACGPRRMRDRPRPVKRALSRVHRRSAGAFHANDAMRVTAGATAARMATRHARLGGGVSWRECHGLDAGGRGQAGAFTAPAPIFPRRSRRGRYDSAPAVPQEMGDEALALAQLFSRCLHVARRACGDHGAVDLVQCRGGVLSSVRVTMGWGSPCCALGGADPRGLRPACRRHHCVIHVGTHPCLPPSRTRARPRCRNGGAAAGIGCGQRCVERPVPAACVWQTLAQHRCRAPRPRLRRRTPVPRGLRAAPRRVCRRSAPSRRRAHRVPTNADGRVSRCRRREPRIR